ncbi:c-type cytochrome [Derxia gummosa]|uniref:C-type cytochrome n=1 Tax=Derxia gummosa DSM 723 TaxID=1121388 RepID=A0A8B6X780_9BURK|nr:cytochrome c [Derxia gummosa]
MNSPLHRIGAGIAASALCLLAGLGQTSAAEPSVQGKLSAAGEGRRLYLKLNCYACHGMGGTGGMGPNIVHAERGDVAEAVLRGEDGGMRSYKGYVTAADISNLAAYLRSIGSATEPKFNDWWEALPSK